MLAYLTLILKTLPNITFTLGEEYGWRGYLLPRRGGPRASSDHEFSSRRRANRSLGVPWPARVPREQAIPTSSTTYTYMPDIGKGLVVLGKREEAPGRAWHLPNPETVTTREFVHMIFEEAGGEPKMQRAPKPLLWTLEFFNPALRETIEMLYEFEEPFVVDHSAFA